MDEEMRTKFNKPLSLFDIVQEMRILLAKMGEIRYNGSKET